MSILMAFTAAMLFSVGTYLVLQRKLSRIIIGIGLMTHGANVVLVTSGRRGTPPIIGKGEVSGFADPLPQALALTAIVISFGVTALLLALAYRSWLLTHDDVVADDSEDRTILTEGFDNAEVADALDRAQIDADADVDPPDLDRDVDEDDEGDAERGGADR